MADDTMPWGGPSPATPDPQPRSRVIAFDPGTPPARHRLRPPRALWGAGPARGAVLLPPDAVDHGGARQGSAAVPDPMLLVTCSESRVVEQLRAHLPTVGVLTNLGGVLPRSPRASHARADVAALDAALDDQGVRHVVCVGHLGCRVTQASARYATHAGVDDESRRAQSIRAIEHHVFMQLHRLRSYLRGRRRHPALRLTGLWVDERTGHVFAFDPVRRAFAVLRDFDLGRFSAPVPERGSCGRSA